MSGSRVKLNWIHAVGQSNLPTVTKAVAFALAAHMNGRGEAFPSASTIAAYASVSERTARRHLRDLEPVFVRVERRRGFSNRFVALPLTPDAVVTGVNRQTPVTSDTHPGHSSDHHPGHSSDLRNGFEIERNEVSRKAMTNLALPAFVKKQLERNSRATNTRAACAPYLERYQDKIESNLVTEDEALELALRDVLMASTQAA
jgi:hypothetical protein